MDTGRMPVEAINGEGLVLKDHEAGPSNPIQPEK